MVEHPEIRQTLKDAIAHHRAGRLGKAEAGYRAVLAASPEDPDALHLLGVLLHQRGDRAAGEELIRRSLEILPSQPRALNNLGNVCAEGERFPEAVEAYRRSIELAPEDVGVRTNLGHSLRKSGREAEARAEYEGACEKALALDVGAPATWMAIGALHEALGRWKDAAEAYGEALARDGTSIPALRRRGALLRRLGRVEAALAVYDRWVELAPDDPVARHLRAACASEPGPDRAPDEFVRAFFDGLAGEFDECLSDLGYRAPELVVRALAAHRSRLPARELDILDAGCGTGLCAASGLTAAARRLVGVDLSAAMLEKARARGGYDELVEAELGAWLGERSGEFDLVVSADTLVYFGDLGPALAAAAGALRRPGLLLFTVEKMEEDAGGGAGYRLNRFGRYQHAESYLRAVLEAAGSDLLRLEETVLRQESGEPVTGLLVVAEPRS